MLDNLLDLTAYGLAREVEAGEVSASEAAEVANARTGEVEDEINALVTITPGLALERAEAVDAKNGERALWEGVPLVVKDVLSTRGVRTTCGSTSVGPPWTSRWATPPSGCGSLEAQFCRSRGLNML